MASLTSLPHELILQIAHCELLNERSLFSLIQANRHFYSILWEALYKRARHHPIGLIRCIIKGALTAVSKFIEIRVNVNAKVDLDSCHELDDSLAFSSFPFTYPLLAAVIRGDGDIVDQLLSQGAVVEARIEREIFWATHPDCPWDGASMHTALSVALMLGHDDIAVRLVEAMEDLNAVVCTRCGKDYTALGHAALCLRPRVVRQLLLRGANPDYQDPKDRTTVLHVLLADAGLPLYINRLDNGEGLLMDVVMLLLEQGADPLPQAAVSGARGSQRGRRVQS
ncbi:hypothetical protein VTI74DRAFT_5966 [Chaetomium olivicolor]